MLLPASTSPTKRSSLRPGPPRRSERWEALLSSGTRASSRQRPCSGDSFSSYRVAAEIGSSEEVVASDGVAIRAAARGSALLAAQQQARFSAGDFLRLASCSTRSRPRISSIASCAIGAVGNASWKQRHRCA